MSGATTTLQAFYRRLDGENPRPVEPGSPYYTDILGNDPGRDPILNLKTRITWAESESVNLLTGFRGNGKSTELRRLKRLLEHEGCQVYLVTCSTGSSSPNPWR